MKYIKLFEALYGPTDGNQRHVNDDGGRDMSKLEFVGEYKSNDFDKFVEDVELWEKETGKFCPWALYPGDQHLWPHDASARRDPNDDGRLSMGSGTHFLSTAFLPHNWKDTLPSHLTNDLKKMEETGKLSQELEFWLKNLKYQQNMKTKKSFEEAKKRAKWYWDVYVKPGKKMALVEGNDNLFSMIFDADGKITNCFDLRDATVKDETTLKRVHDVITGKYSSWSQSKLQSVLNKALDSRDYETVKKISPYLKESKKYKYKSRHNKRRNH
jgi:hypothetical protein